MRVRISFDALGPIDRPFVQISFSLPDGAYFVWDLPPPTEWPKSINVVRRYSWEKKHTNQAMKFRSRPRLR
jgi:hypothetical protein